MSEDEGLEAYNCSFVVDRLEGEQVVVRAKDAEGVMWAQLRMSERQARWLGIRLIQAATGSTIQRCPEARKG